MTNLELFAAELGTFVATTAALPFSRLIAPESLDAPSRHPTPVVLVHGLFGSPANFWTLRHHLSRRGIARFTNFTYRPQIDYQGLASRLGAFLDDLCRRTATDAVDVVGHSLGGLVARYLIEQGDGRRMRRLVTLGSPWYGPRFPGRELALFGAADWLVPTPGDDAHGQIAVIPRCGHLSLLHAGEALEQVARHLSAGPRTIRLAVRSAALAA
jgi:pimeloyl-ACP methyl ester carboxylesterase